MLLVPGSALLALPAAPVLASGGGQSTVAGLLPSPPATPCVAGVVLCGDGLVTQPSPCIAGQALCGSPLPTACVSGIVCSTDIIGNGPGKSPGGGPSASPTVTQTTTPTSRPTTGPGTAVAAPLGGAGPPVPVGPGGAPVAGLNPDALASLLTLSIRDGLTVGKYHLWPWLAGLQLLTLLVLLGVRCSQQLSATLTKPTRV